ncbi:type 4a pilus biogenesis protein PilO [Candidatus Omnitrophota bacterium]
MNNEQLKKIKQAIAKLKTDLGPRNLLIAVYGLILLALILAFVFFYRPLSLSLSQKQREFKALEQQLAKQRKTVARLQKIDLQGRLMPEKEVSQAIDEITEKGRGLNLKFISITPGELEQAASGNFKQLPIDFEIEAEYQNLGKFLIFLEAYPRSIAAVDSLRVRPLAESALGLDIELSVNLYMEGKDGPAGE